MDVERCLDSQILVSETPRPIFHDVKIFNMTEKRALGNVVAQQPAFAG